MCEWYGIMYECKISLYHKLKQHLSWYGATMAPGKTPSEKNHYHFIVLKKALKTKVFWN